MVNTLTRKQRVIISSIQTNRNSGTVLAPNVSHGGPAHWYQQLARKLASAPLRQHRHGRHRDARAQVYVAGLNEDAFAIGTTGVVIPAPLDGGSNVWIAKWCVRTAAALWCPRARPAYGGLLAHKRRAVGGELSLGAPLPHLHHDSPAPHLPPDPALIASRRLSDFGSRAVRSGGSTGTGPTASSRTTRGSRPSRASSTGQSPAGTKRKSVRAHACAPIDTRIFGVCAN